MHDDTYETVKSVLAENERLFGKLLKVAREYDAIDFDESGLYEAEVARCERHWNTLASKVRDALGDALETAKVRLMKNETTAVRSLRLEIAEPEAETIVTTLLQVDYANEGEIAISR
jgi:hypothetical protein